MPAREVSDKIWFNDLGILFSRDRLAEFVPSQDQSDIEKLNSIVRFSVIAAIILSLYRRSFNPYLLTVFMMGLTFVVYSYSENRKRYEMMTQEELKNCTKPDINNPFMNVLLNDYAENPTRGPACSYYDESKTSNDIKKDIKEKFDNNLFTDFEDVFQRKNSARQFYTMPSTTIPSDRESYQDWLYKRGKSCKESNENCIKNIYETTGHNPMYFEGGQ